MGAYSRVSTATDGWSMLIMASNVESFISWGVRHAVPLWHLEGNARTAFGPWFALFCSYDGYASLAPA
jgi:hypothetical protein